MRERPSRDERRENRELKQQAKLRGMTLEQFREQRDKYHEEFHEEQEAKLDNGLKVSLDSDTQFMGNKIIRAWEGNYPALIDMIDAAYGDRTKARKVLNKIIAAVGDDRLAMTDGAVLKISENSLSLVGVHSNGNGVAVESVSRHTPMAEPVPTNQRQEPVEAPPIPYEGQFKQRPDGTWTNHDGPKEDHNVSVIHPETPEEDNEEIEKPVEWEEMILTAYRGESPVSFPIQIARIQVESGQYSYEVDGLPWGEMSENRFKRLLFQNSYYSKVIKDEGITRPNQLLLMDFEV